LYEGKHTVRGNINAEPNPETMWYFLESVFGIPNITSGDLVTHVFDGKEADFSNESIVNPLTIEINRGVNSSYLYYDVAGDSLTLDVKQGELVESALGVVGAGYTKSAESTPEYSTSKPFTWDQVSASFNGATMTNVEDISIKINNNLEAYHTLQGSKAPYLIKRTDSRLIEVSGSLIFETSSYQQAFESQSQNSLKLNFKSVGSESLLIDLPSLKFTSFESTIDGPDLLRSNFTAEAEYNVGSGTCGTFTLKNEMQYTNFFTLDHTLYGLLGANYLN